MVVKRGVEPNERYFNTDRPVAVTGGVSRQFPEDKRVLSEGTKQLFWIDGVAPNVVEC